MKTNKIPTWQQAKQQQQQTQQQQQHQLLQTLPQPSPQALNMSFPYQNQQTSQHGLIQQHNQVPRNQVNQTPSVFESSEISHQNGLLTNLHHHNQSMTSNGSNLSSFSAQLSSFPSHSAQLPFHQLPPPPSGTNLGLNESPSGNLGSGFPTPHQSYGMKLRQPPFSPWQEDSPPLPPQSWWRGDRQTLTRQNSGGSNQQDESVPSQTSGSQINMPFSGINYLQGNILQQPVPRISMKSPTDLIQGDLYGANWHSRPQMPTRPPPLNLNLNLQHQLLGGGNFTPSANTQSSVSRSLMRNSTGYQTSQSRPDSNQLSMFANTGNQEPRRLNPEVKCLNTSYFDG